MVQIKDIWESINDKCWPIADALHVGDLFEDNKIPPVVIPLAFIALLLILAMLLSSHAQVAPEPYCGDGTCDANESTSDCPDDCRPVAKKTMRLTISLNEAPSCQLTVKLYGSSGEQLSSQKTQKSSILFDGIDKPQVRATIEGPYGKSQSLPAMSLDEEETTLQVTLDKDLCAIPQAPNGVLRLIIKDSSTGLSVDGAKVSIAEMQNGQILNYISRDQTVSNGMQDFSMPHSRSYFVYAEKGGYDGYDNSQEPPVYVLASQPVSKTILLDPIAEEMGDLEVCANSEQRTVSSGIITIQDASGTFMLTGDLANADPASEATSSECYVFKGLPAGKIVSISMPMPPPGCIPAAPKVTTIVASAKPIVYLDINCPESDVGYLKVKVIGNSTVLTENATITVWTEDGSLVPGNGLSGSLGLGSGGYSEEVTVPANTPLYVWARGLSSGYLDYKSENLNVTKGQHKALDIRLNYTNPLVPTNRFAFDGFSAPSIVSRSEPFTVTVRKILFDNAELTPSTSTVSIRAGGGDCILTYNGSWSANCTAPNTTGQYEVLVKAEHQSLFGEYASPLEVRAYLSGSGILKVTPVMTTHGSPPIALYYDITLNNVQVTSLFNYTTTLKYLPSQNAYPGELKNFSRAASTGYWNMQADVPYKGDYQITLHLDAAINGTHYTGTYTLGFTSEANSDSLIANAYPSDSILTPLESLLVEVELTFKGKVASGLTVFELFSDGVFYTLLWNPQTSLYKVQYAVPQDEVCTSKLRFIVNGEEIDANNGPVDIHILDLSETKAGTCPLDRSESCDSVEEVRKCVYNNEAEISVYSQEQMTTCIASGCSMSFSECGTANKGDMDLDCKLTDSDVGLFETYLQTVESMSSRNKRASCMDMDNDEDVDKDDLTCLKNLASGKWYGDSESNIMSDASCSPQMDGGFCFDIDIDSELPGDMAKDGKLDVNDGNVMEDIITAASAGVTPPQELLDIADFNMDGAINSVDLECIERFYPVDFTTGEVLSISSTIPDYCMRIFGMECSTGKGDLNADGQVTLQDLIIMKLMVYEYLNTPSSIIPCADINSNGDVGDYDLECLQAYFDDWDKWLACLNCDSALPEKASYSIEICNDGYDNDCDGLTDDEDTRCACTAATPCAMRWDTDGGLSPGIEDGNYRICAKMPEKSYEWLNLTAINSYCDESSQWKDAYKCGSDVKYTCVFSYKEGFKYPDTATNGTFAWLEGNGNIGPLGVTSDCDSSGNPGCAQGWTQVHASEGTECGTEYEKWCDGNVKRCSFCRFNYDFCRNLTCSSSGKSVTENVTEAHSVCAGEGSCLGSGYFTDCNKRKTDYSGPAYGWCASGWGRYAESCPSARICMGKYA